MCPAPQIPAILSLPFFLKEESAYALDHLLENFYIDDWNLTQSTEKQRRLLIYAIPDPDKWQ
jgi:hypothetical protein